MLILRIKKGFFCMEQNYLVDKSKWEYSFIWLQ